MALTEQERHVMDHATARSTTRHRNHFVAEPGHDDWDTLTALVSRGLMVVSRPPSEISGGGTVFSVTSAGLAELDKTMPCQNFAPPDFAGHWRDWHRGHGCPLHEEEK